MRTLAQRLLGLTLAAVLAACGDESQSPSPPAPPPAPARGPPAVPYRVLPHAVTWGAIEGTVALARAVPIPRIVATKDLDDLSWRERDSDIVAFDPETLALRDAVVFLREIGEGKDWPEALRVETPPLTLTLRDGMWYPHVQWSRRGCAVSFANEQARAMAGPKLYRMPWERTDRTQLQLYVMLAADSRLPPFDGAVLRQTGRYELCSDCCGMWSIAHVLVFDHPYVAGPTALDGAYVLEQVPPGDYELVAWHGPIRLVQPPEGGAQFPGGPLVVARRVTIAPGARVRVDLTLTP